MSRPSDMTLARFDALKVENLKLITALGTESERLTVALGALHQILALKPDFTSPEVLYFAMRDIAREGILGKP